MHDGYLTTSCTVEPGAILRVYGEGEGERERGMEEERVGGIIQGRLILN